MQVLEMKKTNGADGTHRKPAGGDRELTLTLNTEETAALEGWRMANNIGSPDEAARELLRLGLLSEISKVYGLVSAIRHSVGDDDDFAYQAPHTQN